MKVTAENFGNLIREVVQAEVKRQLPGLIREVLTESYLRKMVSEQTRRTSSLAEDLAQNEEEEIPEPLRNDNQGIYQQSPLIKNEVRKEVTSKLLQNNPMAFIYEGVQPIKQSGGYSQPVPATEMNNPAGIDLRAFGGLDPERMKMAAGLSKKKVETAPEDSEQMKRLNEMRRKLDSEFVG